MAGLTSASLESYGRLYPYLLQLHVLREIENSFHLIYFTPDDYQSEQSYQSNESSNHLAYFPDSSYELVNINDRDSNLQHSSIKSESEIILMKRNSKISKWDWDGRFQLLSPSGSDRSLVLAARRCILQMCGMNDKVADNWLTVR